jgi:magnesium chelatase family protein
VASSSAQSVNVRFRVGPLLGGFLTSWSAKTAQGLRKLFLFRSSLEAQRARVKANTKIPFGLSRMTSRQLRKYCVLDQPSIELLKEAVINLNLSARAYDRILKVARTIADLAASPRIQSEHLAEAVQYRALDRSLW